MLKSLVRPLIRPLTGGGVSGVSFAVKDTYTDIENATLELRASETGQEWDNRVGTIVISSNRATVSSAPAIATVDCGSTEYSVGCVIRLGVPSSGVDSSGVVFRFLDNDNYWLARIDESSNLFVVDEIESGVASQRGSVSVEILSNTDYSIQVFVSEDSIKALLNSGNAIDVSSTVHSTATSVGIYGEKAGFTFDDFQVVAGSQVRQFVNFRKQAAEKLGIILDLGSGGSFDSKYVSRPHFFEANSSIGKYHLYYNGNTISSVAPGNAGGIGIAVSDDGLNWTKWGRAKDSSGPVDITGHADFFVMQDGANVVCYFSRNQTTISRRIATDSDATIFGAATNVLNTTAASWDSTQIRYPSVVKKDGTYYLYYMGFNGTNWNIGLATSNNGTTFTKHPSNPILPITLAAWWEETHTFDPHVFIKNGKFYMGYTGGTVSRTPFPVAQTFYEQIGMAVSDNGVNWVRHRDNPWIEFGSSISDFDHVHTIDLEMVFLNGQSYAIYTGENTSGQRRIAMAKINVPLD